jgi:glycosyltransferase involved in cell wall biosynthesis
MNSTPLISVIVPVYNSEVSITRCINSVLAQKYTNWELIIVNDGSTDNSKNKAEEIISLNCSRNIRLFDKVNGGVSTARNVGLKNANGFFIAFLDSDDEWFPEKLARQVAYLISNPEVKLIGCWPKQNWLKKAYFQSEVSVVTLELQLKKNYFQPSTVVFEKSVLQTAGYFDESMRYAEEGKFFIEIVKDYTCVLLNINLINFGFNKNQFGESGLSGNLVEMERGELKNLKHAYKSQYINKKNYYFLVCRSILKFVRRVIISVRYV